MVTLPRWLCLFLTLWMAGSRPSAANRTGVLKSSPWWGTKEAEQINRTAAQLRGAGNFSGAESLYEQGYRIATRRDDAIAAIRFLSSIGGVRLEQRRYRAALEPFLNARRLAASNDDRLDLGAVDANLSSLYLQMWDLGAALQMAEAGLAAGAPLDHVYYRHQLLLQVGRLHQVLQDEKAEAYFQKGIEAAREVGDRAQEARGWDLLGEEWLQHGQLSDSERALDEAFRIRMPRYPADVAFSYYRLGALKLAQGDLMSASQLTELAMAAGDRFKSSFPDYLLKHQRGQIRLAQGNTAGALLDFEAAVELAASWRRQVLPAASTLTSTNVELETRIFDSFIETAAGEALRSGNPRWAVESFEALESNRALSMRESMALAEVWRKKLPAEYWDVLGQLRSEESRRIGAKSGGKLEESLKLKLTELEAEAGLRFYTNESENFRPGSSLIHFQHGLSKSEILLSFHLGDKHSYLWAVTRDSVRVYPLAPAARIRVDAAEFRDAVRGDRGDARESAERLYGELFGRLRQYESGKQAWLLSLDDALFETPMAALVTGKGGEMKYLIEEHSLQVVPGALLLNSGTGEPTGNSWFLGVGNPIYNTADSRWEKAGWYKTGAGWLSWRAEAAGVETQLSTLVASSAEVESSARSWSGSTVLLEGSNARREKFMELAARGPAVIHLATHVLTPPTRPGEALIAFGLEPTGEVGYLANSEVALLGVPGAIVSMTGCETGGGEVRAGAGLVGLTRAWLMAGARAVISTAWPVRDSQGEIFASFYRYLRSAPPAEAMRRSQVEMIHSRTWRASPGYWASYQVTGGHSFRQGRGEPVLRGAR